jgi:hypothetical protein
VNASYADAAAVVKEWRRARVEDAERVREIPVVLWAALEVLADGWPS